MREQASLLRDVELQAEYRSSYLFEDGGCVRGHEGFIDMVDHHLFQA